MTANDGGKFEFAPSSIAGVTGACPKRSLGEPTVIRRLDRRIHDNDHHGFADQVGE
jgi:hypothetical protein